MPAAPHASAARPPRPGTAPPPLFWGMAIELLMLYAHSVMVSDWKLVLEFHWCSYLNQALTVSLVDKFKAASPKYPDPLAVMMSHA